MKTCNACGEEKPRSEFHTCRAHKDGLQGRCKDCNKANAAAQFARNKESGVYVLRCTMTAEEYIGSTTAGLAKRLAQHKTAAWTAWGQMRHGDSQIYNCMRTFNDPSMWTIEWLHKMPGASREELLEAEQAYIDARNPALNTKNAIQEVAA